jgi:hypothetical protein
MIGHLPDLEVVRRRVLVRGEVEALRVGIRVEAGSEVGDVVGVEDRSKGRRGCSLDMVRVF